MVEAVDGDADVGARGDEVGVDGEAAGEDLAG